MAACQDSEREDVNDREMEQRLIEACRDGRRDVVESLLSEGVSPDFFGRTLLVVASENGHDDIVRLILDKGVGVTSQNASMSMRGVLETGRSTVVDTRSIGDPNRHCGYRMNNLNRRTSLIEAIARGGYEVVEMLVEQGCSVNDRDSDGRTALTLASNRGYDKVVKTLVEHGCSMDERDDNSRTALIEAILQGHDKVVELLIEQGCSVNERDYDGRTALTLASNRGHDKVVKTLVEHGCSIDERDDNSRTALVEAVLGGHHKVVEILAEHGCSVNEKNCNGGTPFMEAMSRGFDKVVEVLAEHGCSVNKSGKPTPIFSSRSEADRTLMDACRLGYDKVVTILLKKKPMLDLVDRYDRTLFSYAMANKDSKCLRILLKEGILLTDGRLRPVHKNSDLSHCTVDSILTTIELGVFEWEWCPPRYLIHVVLAAMEAGISPGKIKYTDHKYLSPLVYCFMKNDTALCKTLLERMYYYPEDYRTLCTDWDIRSRITNTDILGEVLLQPNSLQTWSFLTVSKAISTSTSGLLVTRCQRVDALAIPEKFKRMLKFEGKPGTRYGGRSSRRPQDHWISLRLEGIDSIVI